MSSPTPSEEMNDYENQSNPEQYSDEEDQPLFKKPKDKVESYLESVVFGGGNSEEYHRAVQEAEKSDLKQLSSYTSHGLNEASSDTESEEEGGELLNFFLSTEPALGYPQEKPLPATSIPVPEEELDEEPKAAWVDDDDDSEQVALAENKRIRKLRAEEEENVVSGAEYQKRLRTQHKNTHASATWADVEDLDAEAEEDMGAFRNVGGVLSEAVARGRLDPSNLQYDRCSDLTRSAQLKGEVRHLEFHPAGEVVLASGPKDPISLIRADGEKNRLLREISFENFQLTGATFTKDGSEIIATSTASQFYYVDVETGASKISHLTNQRHKGGFDLGVAASPNSTYLAFMSSFNSGIHLASGQTKMLIGTLRLPAGIPRAAVWDNEERYLYTLAESSEVFVWDPRTMRCVKRFQDYGGFKASTMALSPDNAYLSIGSKTGILNLYNMSEIKDSSPAPIKAITNITTSIDAMSFNHDSQLLGFLSSGKKDQIKLLHAPSRRVVANWPPAHVGLKICTSIAFSPNSGYVALGNSAGQIPLFRLNSYPLA
ncbi:U3 snoRNP protein [Entomophthora muscae]|uniref:U3 snoRNP protein n=2 Tax=Entomophthora muscae TaxID=34485 RepID=A0ACC2SAF1_9FUNG|nr:U3 snoRNP protein [Entomophthora muscae]